MKRGWITWDRDELPPAAFEKRLTSAKDYLAKRDLDALVVYTDVWRSNQGRYFSNFMPYWNRALLVVPREGAPVLLCGLSPRVYPWIRSVTILEEIRPGANLVGLLQQLCGERNWKRVGVLDLPLLPADLIVPDGVDIPWAAVHPTPDESELLMYRRAANIARETLEAEMPFGMGLRDHEFIGRLELKFRRAGAEDLVILTTNGDTPPLPPNGAVLGDYFSVAVALEYRGHWVKIARSIAGLPDAPNESKTELLSGPYPYEYCSRAELSDGSLFAVTEEYREHSKRVFSGDSWRQTPTTAELL